MSQVSDVSWSKGRDTPAHDRQKGGPLSTPTEPKAPTKQTLDEMVGSRTAAKLPAPPVFERAVVKVEPGAAKGRKAAAELEAAVQANAQAAAEARTVALAQRRALEEVAAAR